MLLSTLLLDNTLYFFYFYCYTENKPDESVPRYIYNKGDYDKLREIINNVNWNEAKDYNVDKYWEFMSNNIAYAIDKCIPMSKPGMKPKKKWVNAKVLSAIKEKQKAWKNINIASQMILILHMF